jgi:hypothetical protein
MKPIIVILLSTCLSIHYAMGQVEKPITKGNIFIGGALSFNNQNIKKSEPADPYQYISNTDTKKFQADLYSGYFILNQFAIGINTNFGIINVKESDNYSQVTREYKYSNLSFGPRLRYYSKAGIFLESSAAIGYAKENYANKTTKWKNYSVSTGIGYNLFLSKSVAIESEIMYTHMSRPPYEDELSEDITNELKLTIGFQVFLDTKSKNNLIQ